MAANADVYFKRGQPCSGTSNSSVQRWHFPASDLFISARTVFIFSVKGHPEERATRYFVGFSQDFMIL